ncbi:MAG: amidohydrolase, partial [Clostridia bacterium]|nr:amidohydrolase [Clostridia bacterium]
MNLVQAVDKNRQLILDALDYIWKNPETGYREVKTSAYLEKEFEKLGYELVRAGNIPGFYADLDTGKEGPTVLIFGELDSLICYDHPEADPETGAVHCCGHAAQAAALLGIAAALKEPGVAEGLCGKVRLCAVPAEELIEVEYRSELKKKGIIKYFGGKAEFLYRGFLDGVDIVYMVHTSCGEHLGGR